MKSRRQEKVFPVNWPTGKCASLGTNQLFFETSFPRFRRTKLVGRVSFPRDACASKSCPRAKGHASLAAGSWGGRNPFLYAAPDAVEGFRRGGTRLVEASVSAGKQLGA